MIVQCCFSGGLVALSPGHSQIYLALWRTLHSPQLQDIIWEWPGSEARRLTLLV